MTVPPDKIGVGVSGQQEEEKLYLASQWRLMWWKFSRHRLAVVSMYPLTVKLFRPS